METHGWYRAHRKWKCQRQKNKDAQFQVPTALFVRSEVLRVKTFCHSVSGSWHFKQTACLHLQALRGHMTLDNKGTTLLQDVRNHSPTDKALCPRICQAQEQEIALSVVYDYLVY